MHRFLFILAATWWASAAESDWPQFLGPTRDGRGVGPALAETWPKDGPRRLWQIEAGQGFAGPAVVKENLILFHRVQNQEVVQCLSAATGESRWRYEYPTQYRDDFGFDEGPRATPAISAGKVYTLGAEGALHCVDLETGKRLWSVDAKTQFSAGKGFFGMACSPLVEGDLVVVNIGGGKGAGVVALDRNSGALRWKATDEEASYSSPVAATIGGKRELLVFTRAGLAGILPSSGQVLFEFPWRSRSHASVNAATPLVQGNEVFLTASYETGAVLLDLTGPKPREVWSSRDALSAHYATPVLVENHLYGFDGRQEMGPAFVCVDWKTGKSQWRKEGLGAGTVTLSGSKLLILTENGELLQSKASPAEFTPALRAQILPRGVRAYPALANGKLFARSKDKLAAFQLSDSSSPR